MYNPSSGLLGPMQEEQGLLGTISPLDALRRMVAQGGQQQGRPPARAPMVPGVQPAPNRPPQPTFSPSQSGFLAGGLTALEESGPSDQPKSLSQIVARSLSAGIPAFLASKAQAEEGKQKVAQEEQFQAMLRSPEIMERLTPAQRKLLMSMGAPNGLAYARELLKAPKHDALKTDERLVNKETGEVVLDAKMRPETLAPGSILMAPDGKGGWEKVGQGGKVEKAPPDAIEAALFKMGMLPSTDPSTLPPEQRDQVWRLANEYRMSGADKGTSVNLPKGEEPFAEALGRGMAGQLVTDYNKVALGEAAGVAVDRALRLVDGPNYVGAGANLKTNVSKIAKDLFPILGGLVDDTKLVNTEDLKNALTTVLIPRLTEMGTRPSDKDMQVLETAIGQITNDPKTLKRVLVAQKKALDVAQNRYNADWLAVYNKAKASGTFMPPNLRPVGVQEDENGRRAFRLNGQWYPVPE